MDGSCKKKREKKCEDDEEENKDLKMSFDLFFHAYGF